MANTMLPRYAIYLLEWIYCITVQLSTKFVLHCPSDKLALHHVLAWHRPCDKVSVSPEQMITEFCDAIGRQCAIYINCNGNHPHPYPTIPNPIPPPHPAPHHPHHVVILMTILHAVCKKAAYWLQQSCSWWNQWWNWVGYIIVIELLV